MDKRLTKILLERYPEIFRDHGGDMMKTCMHWGFEIDSGWFDILDVCCSEIQNNYENAVRNYEWKLERYNKSDEEITKDIETVGEDSPIVKQLQRPEKPEKPYCQLVATQVKEKYGTLRFYSMGGCDADDGAISVAELMSGRICQTCGRPAQLSGGGWIACRCKRCQGIIDEKHEPNNMALMFEKIEEELVQRILEMDEVHKEWMKFE